MIKTFDQWVEGMLDQEPPQGGIIHDMDAQLRQAIQKAAGEGDYKTAQQYRQMLMQRQQNIANRQQQQANAPTVAQQPPTPQPEPDVPFQQQDPSQDPIGPWRKDINMSDLQRQIHQSAQQQKQGFMGKLRGLFGGGG